MALSRRVHERDSNKAALELIFVAFMREKLLKNIDSSRDWSANRIDDRIIKRDVGSCSVYNLYYRIAFSYIDDHVPSHRLGTSINAPWNKNSV